MTNAFEHLPDLNLQYAAQTALSAEPAYLEVSGLSKVFRGAAQQAAVQDVNFSLAEGKILALLGPSGCGKTTTLRMIAGFETPSAGHIALAGQEITQLSPQERGIGIVFQNYALFPHMSVEENVRFGLRGVPKAEQAEKISFWLELFKLGELRRRMPHQLSGGQQQRVAIARTLAAQPKLVLLDEPFSGLDTALRTETRNGMRALFQQMGTTVVLVTHDQIEAMSFADQLGVMSGGRLLQVGAPEQVYRLPRNSFVADFLGTTNTFQAQGCGRQAQCALGMIDITTEHHQTCRLCLRPEQLEIVPDASASGLIVSREFRGHEFFYHVQYGNEVYKVISPHNCILGIGDSVSLRPKQAAVVLED